MGSTGDMTSPKSGKATSSKHEQKNIHLFPDWATMQAYYGPRVPIPPSYLNSPVLPGHVPHPHVWPPPQHLVSPYGVPYSTIYPPGVVYAHPPVPIVAAPLSMHLPSKSSDNTDQGLTKKAKRLHESATNVVNGKVGIDGELSIQGLAQSLGQGIDASSNSSDGNTGVHYRQRKNDSVGKLTTGSSVEISSQPCPVPEGDSKVTTSMAAGIAMAPENVIQKTVDCGNSGAVYATSSAGAGPSFEVWIQDERLLKRERRKQANRESARRSRLRKQAETEEVMKRYETLKMENMSLKSEINQLMAQSEELRVENTALMEKLNGAEVTSTSTVDPHENGRGVAPPNHGESQG
ncbi:hypothetical protein NMG60_11030508 [Bertholletia excelsa]